MRLERARRGTAEDRAGYRLQAEPADRLRGEVVVRGPVGEGGDDERAARLHPAAQRRQLRLAEGRALGRAEHQHVELREELGAQLRDGHAVATHADLDVDAKLGRRLAAHGLEVVAGPQRLQHVVEPARLKGGRASALQREAGDAERELAARGHADAAAGRRAVPEE